MSLRYYTITAVDISTRGAGTTGFIITVVYGYPQTTYTASVQTPDTKCARLVLHMYKFTSLPTCLNDYINV